MQPTPKLVDFSWKIITLKNPIQWARDVYETWLLQPPLRYVVNASQIPVIEEHIEEISSLSMGSNYRPLYGEPLRGSKILVERHRDRGVGDHLFLTGIYKFLHQLSGGTCKIYQYALHSRSQWLNGCPWLASESCLNGPICYDNFQAYNHHWFVDQATEYTAEPDQLNVYDALLKSLNINPDGVADIYKRPYCFNIPEDQKKHDTFLWKLYRNNGTDLRVKPYCVVSPLCHSTLRSVPYQLSLAVIQEMAKKMPVIVIGDDNFGKMPTAGVPYSQFVGVIETLASTNRNIVNLLGPMPPRLSMNLISNATFAVTPDTGTLYVAQGYRVPAISLWGTHSPTVRIGYDKMYMDLAIHKTSACRNSPCYSYRQWPFEKCPKGVEQNVCAPLQAITLDDVMAKVKMLGL